ncbi:hypothetical protein ACFLZZ_02275 [Nanoarchaeota archaeon]
MQLAEKTTRLATIIGCGGLDGSVALAALSGLFTLENAPLIAVLFLAGPGAIVTATLFDGAIQERMIAALLAGLIATSIVALAAGLGPKVLEFVNITTLKVIGGIAIMTIGLLIMGIKIPQKLPLAIMGVGIILSLLTKTGGGI